MSELDRVRVRAVRRVKGTGRVCDVTVHKNHNLFASAPGSSRAVLVHNCNAVFDLHQLYDWLRLRWYNHNVWDVQYGEFSLDENREARSGLGFSGEGDFWGLERICQEHGMFHYSTAPVRKHERARLASTEFWRVAEYGALDAALPMRVMFAQREIARRRNAITGQPYARFSRNVLLVEGRKTLQITHMERTGTLIDAQYVASMAHPDSEFQRDVREAEQEWRRLPDVVEANRRLVRSSNISGRSLWNSSQERWVFDVNKQAHQQMLFVDVCGLKPLGYGVKGAASLGKEFKTAYRHVPIVTRFSDLMETRTSYGTFVVGFQEAISNSPDMRIDGRLRPRYDGKATTSRLKCSRPNAQNIPTRRPRAAKTIKRQFVARRGRLYRKRDLSAHEVRVLGITARDPLMAERFWSGMQTRLRYEYQVHISPERQAHWAAQLKGADVHHQNYGMIYNVDPLLVTKEQRDSIKVPIFSITYGKSAKTMGEEVRAKKLMELEDARELAVSGRKASDGKPAVAPLVGHALKAELDRIEDAIAEVNAVDWTKYAEDLIDLIFNKKFSVSGRWLQEAQRFGARTTLAPNILGGVRHLPAYLHPQRHIINAAHRRNPNSRIQGPASNLGLEAGYLLREMCWKWFVRYGVPLENDQCNAVHDSSESETSIVQIPLLNYLEAHAFSTCIHLFMRDTMGFPFNVGLESDVEVGASLSSLSKAVRWDDEVKAIREGIRWGNENLGWQIPEERVMRAVEHNARIIHGLRRREIARQLRDGTPTNYHMEMNERNARSLGLVFSVDIGEPRAGASMDEDVEERRTTNSVDWRNELVR